MKIYGLQKLSLVDWPGLTVATLFTGGCNFDCPYCQNSSLVEDLPSPFSNEEIFDYLKLRKNLLDGVCISGGEPLIHSDIEEFIKDIKALGYRVKLDTNGSFPERLEGLIKSGLVDYVAMDIKNIPKKYPLTAGCAADTSGVFASADLLICCGTDFEFRTTVSPSLHEPGDFDLLGKRLKGARAYYLQAFRLSEGVRDKSLAEPDSQFMENCLARLKIYLPDARIRGI